MQDRCKGSDVKMAAGMVYIHRRRRRRTSTTELATVVALIEEDTEFEATTVTKQKSSWKRTNNNKNKKKKKERRGRKEFLSMPLHGCLVSSTWLVPVMIAVTSVVLVLFCGGGYDVDDGCRHLRLLHMDSVPVVESFIIVGTTATSKMKKKSYSSSYSSKNNNVYQSPHNLQRQRQQRSSMLLWSSSRIQNDDDEINTSIINNSHDDDCTSQPHRVESTESIDTTAPGAGGGGGTKGRLYLNIDEKTSMDKKERYDADASYSIHRVDSRQRILDLLVFRYNKTTLDEYLSSSTPSSSPPPSESQRLPTTTTTTVAAIAPDGDDDENDDENTIRDNALRKLTEFYDDNGQDLMFVSSTSPPPVPNNVDKTETTDEPYSSSSFSSSSLDYCALAQFYVLWHHDDTIGGGDGRCRPVNDDSHFIDQSPLQDDEWLRRTNGIVGSVDARRMSLDEIDKGMEETLDDIIQTYKHGDMITDDGNRKTSNDHVVLVELKNLRVHPSMRRKGIGKALIEAVQEYAKSIACLQGYQRQQARQRPNEVIVFLQVDPTNRVAQQLYEKVGFISTREEYGRMDWKMTQ